MEPMLAFSKEQNHVSGYDSCLFVIVNLSTHGFDDRNTWKGTLQRYNSPAGYLNFSLLFFSCRLLAQEIIPSVT